MGNWWLKPIKWILLANYKNVVMIGHFPFWKLAIWGEMPVYCWIFLNSAQKCICCYLFVCLLDFAYILYIYCILSSSCFNSPPEALTVMGKISNNSPQDPTRTKPIPEVLEASGGGWMRANGRRWIKMINIFWFTESQTDIYMNENWLFILNKQWVNH